MENVEVQFCETFVIYWQNYLPDTQGGLTSGRKQSWIRSVMSDGARS